MLNVAVCPAVIFALVGCDEIVGATGALVVGWPMPVPLKVTQIVEPVDRLNSSVPE